MKILFIDRDGTLIYGPNGTYVDSLSKFKILPYVVESLIKLQSVGYKFIMISNQPGLGTEKLPKKSFLGPQNELMRIFKENNILFEATYFCPHFREDNCSCMKPKTGLVNKFIDTYDIDMSKSYTIGDNESDVMLSKNIGCKSIFYSDVVNLNSDYYSHDWRKIADFLLKEAKS